MMMTHCLFLMSLFSFFTSKLLPVFFFQSTLPTCSRKPGGGGASATRYAISDVFNFCRAFADAILTSDPESRGPFNIRSDNSTSMKSISRFILTVIVVGNGIKFVFLSLSFADFRGNMKCSPVSVDVSGTFSVGLFLSVDRSVRMNLPIDVSF